MIIQTPTPILDGLMEDSITISDQVTGNKVTFEPVRVRETSGFYQMPYGMDKNRAWQIWADSRILPNFDDFLNIAKVDNMVTFIDPTGQTLSVRIDSVDLRKTNFTNIHHVKVVCI